MNTKQHQSGFTLIEMCGALFLMGAMIAMGSGVYLGKRMHLMDRAAAQIGASVRLARSRALLHGRPMGVQFRVQTKLYVIFSDVGLDHKAPGDVGYTEPDEGERNNRYDFDAESGRGEPASDFKNTLIEGISFGILAEPGSMSPDESTPIGSNPIPSEAQALVFDARGQLIDTSPGANFVYLIDQRRTEMRALSVDPWIGYVQTYRWDTDAKEWSYR